MRLLDLHKLYFGRTEEGDLLAFDEGLQKEVRGILESLGWWKVSQSLEENLQGWLGWHNLEERWVGTERLDPVVLGELRKASNA